jgi:hypothetical protein
MRTDAKRRIWAQAKCWYRGKFYLAWTSSRVKFDFRFFNVRGEKGDHPVKTVLLRLRFQVTLKLWQTPNWSKFLIIF